MPEISDAELAALNEYKQAHALLKALHDDGAISVQLEKLVKQKFPNASTPKLDLVATSETLGADLKKQFDEAEAGRNKRLDDLIAERKKEKEDAQVASFADTVAEVSKKRGYTEEGKTKVLELMKERGIQNFEDAADLFDVRQPKPAGKPRSFSSRMPFVSPDGEKDESYERLMADPEQWMGDELMTAIGNQNTDE